MRNSLLITAALVCLLASGAFAGLVINEVEYDENGPTADSTEFIELYNSGGTPIDASAYTVRLYNGATDGIGDVYTTVTLPGAAGSLTTVIPAGGFYVIGDTALVLKNQAFATASDSIQNGSPDAIALHDDVGTILDGIAYEGGGTVAYTAPAGTLEGNAFRGLDATTTPVAPQVSGFGGSIGRFPDGADTNDNTADFHVMPPTPQAANAGTLPLPYSNSFDTVGPLTQTASPAIYNVFVSGPAASPDVVALPIVGDTTIPVSPDPSTPGSALRIRDISGGGDEWWFGGPGNTGTLSITGYWYLKTTTAMTGETSGITLKNTKTPGFFGTARSTSSSFGYESGVSVTYSAGVPTIQGIPATAGTIKVDAHTSAPEADTNLASIAMAGDRWVPFRISLDFPGNTFFVEVDGIVIYQGPVPAGCPTAGGVTLGYRQNGGTFTRSNGAFFDGINITTTAIVPAELSVFSAD